MPEKLVAATQVTPSGLLNAVMSVPVVPGLVVIVEADMHQAALSMGIKL